MTQLPENQSIKLFTRASIYLYLATKNAWRGLPWL